MTRFILIKRRDGEEVPINPDQVDYVRRVGQTTTIALGSGATFRVGATVEEVINALEATGGERQVIEGERHPGGMEIGAPASPGTSPNAPGTAGESAADQTPSGASADQPGDDDDVEQQAAHDDREGRPARSGRR